MLRLTVDALSEAMEHDATSALLLPPPGKDGKGGAHDASERRPVAKGGWAKVSRGAAAGRRMAADGPLSGL